MYVQYLLLLKAAECVNINLNVGIEVLSMYPSVHAVQKNCIRQV